MKKFISLALVAPMVFGLCACGSSSTDATEEATEQEISADEQAAGDDSTLAEDEAAVDEAAAEEELEIEEEAEDSQAADEAAGEAFVWNGEKEVWSILPTTGAQGLVDINDAMGAVMEDDGFTYVKKDAEGDPGNQVNFVEDAIAAGNVGCLMIAAMDVDLLKDVCQRATDAGIAIAMLGAQPTDYTIAGGVYTAYEITGMYAVEAAEDWVLNSGAEVPTDSDGKYEIALDTYYGINDGVYRSNAIIGTVENSDVLVNVSETSSYGDSAYSDAHDNAVDVLNAHPDCHIFIAYEPEEAMGIASAIADYASSNGEDLSNYCVIPCYSEDEEFLKMIDEAFADPSANAVKGYSTYGDAPEVDSDGNVIKDTSTQTGEHLAEVLLGVCGEAGYSWDYGEFYYDTITAVNVCGFEKTWSMGDDNPAIEYKHN